MPSLPYQRSAVPAESPMRALAFIYRHYYLLQKSPVLLLAFHYSHLTNGFASTTPRAHRQHTQETRPFPNPPPPPPPPPHQSQNAYCNRDSSTTQDNPHDRQSMAVPWTAKLPFLGIAGCDCDGLTAASPRRTCCSYPSTYYLARCKALLPETYISVANGAADASPSYAVHARVLCQALPRQPCARSQ